MANEEKDPLLGLPPCPKHWWDEKMKGWTVHHATWGESSKHLGHAWGERTETDGSKRWMCALWMVGFEESFSMTEASSLEDLHGLMRDFPRDMIVSIEGLIDEHPPAKLVIRRVLEGGRGPIYVYEASIENIPFSVEHGKYDIALERLAKALGDMIFARDARIARMKKRLEEHGIEP